MKTERSAGKAPREALDARRASRSQPILIEDLRQLRTFAASKEFASKRPVILRIPELPAMEMTQAMDRLNKGRMECGCSLGAQALLAGLLIALGAVVLRHGGFTLATLERLPMAGIAGAISAGLGKVAGIAMGRRRARHEVARLLSVHGPE